MNKKCFLIILLLIFSLPVYAVNCYKKPCHKDCINNQSQAVKTQCWCNARKNVYYHLKLNPGTGVPEYSEVCDGDFEQYAMKYCSAKRHYDNAYLSNPNYAYTYTPQYDSICDGSFDRYSQNMRELKRNQAMNNMADAMRTPIQIDVNHSGTVNHNVNLNGTIRTHNYYY